MNKYFKGKTLNSKNLLLIGGAVYITLSSLYRYLRGYMRKKELLQIRKEVHDEISKKISSVNLKEVSNSIEKQIINSKLSELREGLKNRTFSSEDIVTSFIRRTIKYGQKFGWITDVNFNEALETAKQCDININEALLNGSFDSLPSLFGIPFSVKDHIKVKGLISTFGLIHQAKIKDDADSDIVAILRSYGAIPFVKSTMPFAGMSIHTHSNLWGDALNPWNEEKTTGGSSGGEAGLISSGCSPFGVGSDAAGSLRIPASFCGISSLMPSLGRVSPLGVLGFIRDRSKETFGLSIFNLNVGIMAKFSEDINFVHQQLNSIETHKLIKYIPNVPWKDNIVSEKRKLRIGYFYTDYIFDPCTTSKRAVSETIQILNELGHETVEFKHDPKEFAQIFESFFKILFADQGKIMNHMVDEENFDVYFTKFKIHNKSKYSLKILKWILKIFGEKRFAIQLHTQLNGNDMINENVNIMNLRYSFFKEMTRLNLDAIVCPVMAYPAPNLVNSHLGSLALSYTTLFNYLCVPVGVVPITLMMKNELDYIDNINDSIGKFINETVKSGIDLPMGIQVVSYQFNDEIVVRIMNEIQSKSTFPYKRVIDKFD